METEATSREAPSATQKNPIDGLSKDEVIIKYKGLLNIAKKAKQAKDDLTEENRQLKDALTRAAAKQSTLPAMQEMVQDLTDKNLILTEQVSALQRKGKESTERLTQLEIENESLKRQLGRLSDENDGLLADIERMEQAMQQVNVLGNEQRKNLELLEVDVVKMKETEVQNDALKGEVSSLLEENNRRVVELEELQEKYRTVKDLNSAQRKKFNSLKDRFIDVHRKLKNLKECKCVLLETQHEYAASVSKWQQEIIKASQLLCSKMSGLQQENETLRGQLITSNGQTPPINDIKRDNGKIEQKLHELERVAQLINQEHIDQQQEEARHRNSLLKKLIKMESLTNIIRKQQDQQHHNTKAEINTHKCIEKLNRMQKLTTAIVEERSRLQLEQRQLQQELHDLKCKFSQNQHNDYVELKAQLEASQATVGKLQEEVHKKAHKSSDDQETLQMRYKQKEAEHTELLAEMRELNEALKARGDVISRLQEQQATEAKSVALKHKELEARVEQEQQALSEKTKQVEQLQTRIIELEQELQQNINADAQSDVLSTSTISRAEELSRLREVDDGYEEKYNKLRALAARLKKKLQEQTQQIKQMDDQVAASAALQAEIEANKAAQAQLQQDLNAARAENQKLKTNKGKNTSVLDLEIEAAEKSLADASAKLAAKSIEMGLLNEALSSKENAITQLRKEIGILEAAQKSEAAHAKQLKEQIDLLQTQVKDAVHGKQQSLMQNKELEQNLEQLKLDLEELRLQSATSAQQHEASLSSSKQLVASTTQELHLHVKTIGELEIALRNAERAQEDLRLEYLDYKVKAQAVLRKNQNKDSEYELEAEIKTLRSNEQQLRNTIEEQASRLEKQEKQLEILQEDNTNLKRRSREIMALVEELRQQNERLAQDNQQQIQQHRVELHQRQEQLDQCNDSNKLQFLQLQQQLQQTQEALQQAHHISNLVTMPTTTATAIAPESSTITSAEQRKINMLMDHESGVADGGVNDSLAHLAAQRKISTASRRSHDFMPLDELLNTSINAINSDTVTTFSNFGRSVSMLEDDDMELTGGQGDATHAALLATKERLNIQESRVRHLTALLAENEQDLAKLTQMNDMLKEELRRQERSEEREQHMHNSEYLKNVFLKFLTLNNGDERQRLVPVLNTILRLSRSETEMLNCVANGQKVNSDGSNRGWAGFLSSWTGGSGGGGGTVNSNNNNNNS